MAATACVNLARVLRVTGRTDDAVVILRQNDAWYREHGGGDGALLTRALIGVMSAPDELDVLLDEARRVGDHEVEVLVLDALARIASVRGDHVDVRQRLDDADALMPLIGHAVEDADRIDADLARAELRRWDQGG